MITPYKILFYTAVIALFIQNAARAEKVEIAHGKATHGHHELYIENVETHFDDNGIILNTLTKYVGPDNRQIASMTAEFSDSLNAPTHHFIDERNGFAYGVKWADGKVIMYAKAKNKPE